MTGSEAKRNPGWIVGWLKRTSMWNLLWVAVALSEVFTFAMTTSMTYWWWGKIVYEIVLIGAVISCVVSLSVTFIVIAVLRAYRDVEKEVDESRRMIGAHRERDEVSRWLHDDIGADLFNVVLVVDKIREKQKKSEDVSETLDWVTDASRNALNSIRSYSNFASLKGPVLGDLVGYMRDYGQVLFNNRILAFDFSSEVYSGAFELSPVKSFSIYLIYKEAIANILKHAGARRAKVSLALRDGNLVLTVEDDGRGFDPAKVGRGGSGIRNMTYRAETVSGTFTIDAAEGRGTRLGLMVPVSGSA